MKAPEILARSAEIMAERAKQYDSPEGERSMGKAVAAFNAITGQELTEANGWLLMALLKMVRDNTTDAPHEDSLHDLVAYGALYGESRLASIHEQGASESESNDDGGWVLWEGFGEPTIPMNWVVEYRLRNGDGCKAKASLLWWKHYNHPDDIIAYRIVK